MLGSSITQQLFASANSIAVIPKLWTEWNYNAFIQPYVTTSSSASKISINYNSSAAWTPQSIDSIVNGSITYGTAGTGIDKSINASSTPIAFIINKKLANSSSVTSGKIMTSFSSSAVTFSSSAAGNFNKFIFYVKVGYMNHNYGPPAQQKFTSISSSPVGTTSVTYRIAGVNSSNQHVQNPLALPASTVLVTSTSSVTMSWTNTTTPNHSSSYKIYKTILGVGNASATHYVTTVNSPSYVDLNPNSYPDAYTPGTYSNDIFISPEIVALDPSGNTVPLDVFIKSTDFSTGKLSNIQSSVEATVDVWKRVEVWFGTPKDSDDGYSQIYMNLNAVAEYEGAVFLVSNIELYPITEQDFYLTNYYPTDSSFLPFRPGESLLNPLLPSSDKVIKSDSYTASVTRPITFAIKNTQTYFAKDLLTPQMQMLPAMDDKFTYYISSSKENSIRAQYNQYLSINKIVLKYVNTISQINSGSMLIYTGSNNDVTKIALPSASLNSNGLTVLYYNGSNWSTSSWTSPPQLTSSGTFQNVLNNVRGIGFVATSLSQNSNFTNTNVSGDDLLKMHVVELSPRLELDLTPILESFSVKLDLTSPNNNGFPLSYINSNSGTVELSNIPVYQNNTIGSTIFENMSASSAFSNLLRQGVKFNLFLESPSFQPDLTERVPQLLMYSHSWGINDIDKVSVELYDVTKIYHGMESPNFACERSDLFSIVTTLLNTAGFSDYDYDGLYYVCKSSTTTPSFWYDESKAVMENLQDLFISHQIGAWIDEYGMMRFKSLGNIIQQINSSEFIPNFVITDVTRSNVGSSSLTYIANIIPDTFSESVGEKVGKIQLKYRTPKDFDSADIDSKNSSNSAGETWFLNSESYPQVWKEESNASLANFPLNKTLSISDNFLSFNPNITFVNPRKSIGSYTGELMIGSEIVGYSGMEYVFYPIGLTSTYLTKIITDESDIARAIEEIKDIYTKLGSPITQVEYHPTGRLVGLKRGKYGTTPAIHKVAKDTADFNYKSYSIHNTSLSSGKGTCGLDKLGLFLQASAKDEYVMLYPKTTKGSGHNLFAIDFTVSMLSTKRSAHTDTVRYKKIHNKLVKDKNGKIVKKVKTSAYTDYHNVAVGIFFNMNGTTVNGTATNAKVFSGRDATHFVEIKSVQNNSGKRQVSYLLSFYFIAGKTLNYIIKDYPVSNVFDGIQHRLAIYMQGDSVSIAVDGERISRASKYYVTNRLGKSVSNKPFYNQKGTNFGAFIKSLENQSVKVYIDEVYADYVGTESTGRTLSADEYPIESRYYFTSKVFLDNIVKGFAQRKNYYLYQSFPLALGFKLYDVKHSLSPIRPFSAKIVPVRYGSQAVPSKTNEKIKGLGPVYERDISYSSLDSTPFRSRFAVVNNSDELVILASTTDSQSHEPIQIWSNYQLLTDVKLLERVVDPNYSLTIDLETDWVASQAEAQNILALLAKSTNTFYSDISVSVFGNPLVQVGDFAQITYGLKRIGYNPTSPSFSNPLNCIITSVDKGFSGGVSETKLTLKPLIIS
jgi:hypothetical protein